jgi:hypothetical protein
MMTALLLVLAQPMPGTGSLNLNQQPIMAQDEGVRLGTVRAITVNCVGAGVVCTQSGSAMTVTVAGGGGGGGAPTTATYITQTPDATLTNEQALSALATGLVVNTTATGVLTVYTGASCTNQFVRALTASGAATCASVNLALDVTGNLPVTNLGSGTGASGTTFWRGDGTWSVPAGTYVLPDATNLVTGGVRLTGDLAGTATSPAVVDDSHNHTGATISALDTSDITTGTLPQTRGGMGVASLTCAAGQYVTCDGTLCSCSTPSGGGGGGSANFSADTATFAGKSDTLKTVTAAWASAASNIICTADGEEASVEGAQFVVKSKAAGSFVVRAYVLAGTHTGTLPFTCTGN